MIQVQLLHVPGCPHVDAARRLLSSCMQELGVAASIQEREGAFPSPSILVNGVDATGGLVRTVRMFDDPDQTIHTTRGYDNVTGVGTPRGLLFLLLS